MLRHWKVKIALFITSFVVSFILLEAGLRLTGVFIYNSQNRKFIPYSEQDGYIAEDFYEKYKLKQASKKILTIGDSFTNAGNVPSYNSYPYFLFKLLENSGNPREILNMGVCEDSTVRLERRLRSSLEKNPKKFENLEKVIILVGAADKFERYLNKSNEMYNLSWVDFKTQSFFKRLRVYKAYRHIKFVFQHKYLTNNEKWNATKYESVKREYKKLKNELITDPTQEKNQNFLKKALAELPKPLYRSLTRTDYGIDTPIELLHSLNITLSNILVAKKRHEEAINWLLDLSSTYPIKFFNGDFDEAYFRLVQIYQIQSKFESQKIKKFLSELLSKNPELKNLINFTEIKEMVENWSIVDSKIKSERLAAWKKIIQLSKKHQFKLYIMNYPTDYGSANDMAKQVALENNIPFIDNHKYFQKVIKEYGSENILEDDDHFTPKGYEFLAKHVYENLNL